MLEGTRFGVVGGAVKRPVQMVWRPARVEISGRPVAPHFTFRPSQTSRGGRGEKANAVPLVNAARADFSGDADPCFPTVFVNRNSQTVARDGRRNSPPPEGPGPRQPCRSGHQSTPVQNASRTSLRRVDG